MVEFSLSAGGSIPCWPLFYYRSNKHTQKRSVICCACCYLKKKGDTKQASCCKCLMGYKRSPTLYQFWFLFFFIYKATLDTLFWSLCLLFIFQKTPHGKKIRILFFFVINIPSGGLGSDGFYLTLLYIIKIHKKPDGWRLWVLLLFIRKQTNRLTIVLFPLFSYRWVDNEYLEYQFLLYYSYKNLPPNGEYQIRTLFPFYYIQTDGNSNDNNYQYYKTYLFWLIKTEKTGNKHRKRFFFYSQKLYDYGNRFKWRLFFLIKYKRTQYKRKFSIRPLVFSCKKDHSFYIVILPIGWYYRDDSGYVLWLLLLFRFIDNDSRFILLFPFFFRYRSNTSRISFFWLWYSRFSENRINKSYTLPLPLYYRNENDRHSTWYFLFYYKRISHFSHKKLVAIFPIVTSRYKNDILRRRFYFFMVYGYYCPVEGDEEYLSTGYDILWPLIKVERNEQRGTYEYRVLPFYYEKGTPLYIKRAYFPLYYYKLRRNASGEQTKLTRVFLLGAWFTESNYEHSYYIAPLWIFPPYIWKSTSPNNESRYSKGFWPFYSKSAPGHNNTLYTSHFYPFYMNKTRDGGYNTTRIGIVLYYNKHRGDNEDKTRILFTYYHKHINNRNTWKCLWCGCFWKPLISCFKVAQDGVKNSKQILFLFSKIDYGEGGNWNLSLLWLFHYRFSLFLIEKKQDSFSIRIPLLFYYRKNNENVIIDFRILWIGREGIFKYSVQNTHKQVYLFILFNYINHGDSTNINIFWLFYHNLSLIHSNKAKKRFYIFPLYYSRELEDGKYEKSFIGYRRGALGYFNDLTGLSYILPFYIKYQPNQDNPANWSIIGINRTLCIIRYHPDKFIRVFPIFWKNLEENPTDCIFAFLYLFSPHIALYSNQETRQYILILYYHGKPKHGVEYKTFIWLLYPKLCVLLISEKAIYVIILFYLFRQEESTRYSIIWIVRGNISLIHYYKEGTSRIFPLCSSDNKTEGTTTIKLLFGVVHCKLQEDYINLRLLYRLMRLKVVSGDIKRFEINPVLFCNYNKPGRETCLACGGCAGSTYKGLRCCWCLNAKI